MRRTHSTHDTGRVQGDTASVKRLKTACRQLVEGVRSARACGRLRGCLEGVRSARACGRLRGCLEGVRSATACGRLWPEEPQAPAGPPSIQRASG
jgi:hypothetical protein